MSFAALHADARAVLGAWQPDDAAQEALRQGYLAYLDAVPAAMQRDCAPGHLTASAVVLDCARKQTLLTLHPRIKAWVQLGGHCEATDQTLTGAALREATEESGIATLRLDPVPVQLDVHPLTCSGGVPTRHLDVRFVALRTDDAPELISDESTDLRWFGIDELPAGLDAATRALIHVAAARHELI